MSEIATSNWEIILFYNPLNISSKETLGYARNENLPIREVDITKEIFTGTQLEEIAERLKTNIEGLINKDYPGFKNLYGNADFNDEGWIRTLQKHPEFIKEPIAIKGDQTLIVETPSLLSRF